MAGKDRLPGSGVFDIDEALPMEGRDESAEPDDALALAGAFTTGVRGGDSTPTLVPPNATTRALSPSSDPRELARLLGKAAAAKLGPPKTSPAAPAATPHGATAWALPATPTAPPPRPSNSALDRALAAPPPRKQDSSGLSQVARPEPASSRLAAAPPPLAPRKALSVEAALAAARAAEAVEPVGGTPPRLNPAPPPNPAAPVRAAPARELANPKPPVAARPAIKSAQEATPLSGQDALARAQGVVSEALASDGVSVIRAVLVEERQLQSAIWRAHRGRLVATGDHLGAFSAFAVIQAVEQLPAGTLIAARVNARGRELLLWLDGANTRVIAVFPDAASWTPGLF